MILADMSTARQNVAFVLPSFSCAGNMGRLRKAARSRGIYSSLRGFAARVGTYANAAACSSYRDSALQDSNRTRAVFSSVPSRSVRVVSNRKS